MLNLNLREEFTRRRLKGTAIELTNDTNSGATEMSAQQFLDITYPTQDLLKAVEAVGPDQGRPVVVIGERGSGKSHLLGALYHAVADPGSTGAWLANWSSKLGDPRLGQIALRSNMQVIGESLHRQRFKFLWDVLFEKHPHGAYTRGKWAGMGAAKTDVPSDQLIVEMLSQSPTMLLLDEFQTWFDGLTNTKQYPWRQWAFNFIQILSEIAKEHPELLVLVVSVRNGATDAYQQIHRVNPVLIDFKAGGSPERIQQDRRRMLLHRLFENRLQIAPDQVAQLVAAHVAETFRLLDVPPAEHERRRRETIEAWPFAPQLFQLLEDQVLVATDAQETRDLIKILASLFKAHGERTPILTAADFRIDEDASGIGELLDSVANQQHRSLREKAQRNLLAVSDAVPQAALVAPHLAEIVGALWLRSITVSRFPGAEPATLQVDITRDRPIDDNAFQVELATIVENSFNIHQDGLRLVFREEENPQARLMAHARNDKLFVDGSDLKQLAKEVRYVIGGSDEVARTFRVIALPRGWLTDPWSTLDESEQPERWDDRLPILVLPEDVDRLHERLGRWLRDHLQKRRNTVRFLLPRAGSTNLFQDRDLVVLARASMKAGEWGGQNPEYRRLQTKYQSELRDLLKKRFDRFALLQRWDFTNPLACVFQVESLREQGAKIPEAIERAIADDLFVPEDFVDFVQEVARNNDSVGKLLRDLQEPRPAGQECIPWLGEPAMKERVLRLCARGTIAINLRGTEYIQAEPGEDEDTAWRRMRSKLSLTGRQLDEIFLLLPSAVPATGGATPVVPVVAGAAVLPNVSYTSGAAQTPLQFVREQPETLAGATVEPQAGAIFSGANAARPRVRMTNPPTSPLNLIGKIENWGVGPATPVSDVTIRLTAATGAQLKELLKKLPDGLTFELSLEKEDTP